MTTSFSAGNPKGRASASLPPLEARTPLIHLLAFRLIDGCRKLRIVL